IGLSLFDGRERAGRRSGGVPGAGKQKARRLSGLWTTCAESARPQCSLGGADVGRLQTLGAVRHVEGHALAFGEGLEALALNGREMGEEVIATGFRRDEAKTLGIVEPLDGTCCHVLNLLKMGKAP